MEVWWGDGRVIGRTSWKLTVFVLFLFPFLSLVKVVVSMC